MRKKSLIASAVLLALPGLASAENWADRVEFSGVVEVETTFGEDSSTDNSDTTTATVELGFDAELNDRVSAHVLLLHEEDDTPLELDEGTITLNLSGDGSFTFTGGQMYVPFGNFESHMISDPLTLELGETRQSVMQLGFEAGSVYGSMYLYNGDVIEADADGDDTIENFGANIGFVMESDAFTLDAGISYISNIADSGGFMDNLPTDANGDLLPVESYVSGIGVHAIVGVGSFTGILEYVAADEFEEIQFDSDNASPSAMNVEVGFAINDDSAIAIGYQMTKEAAAMELVENKVLVSYSMGLFDAASFAVEFSQGDYYSTDDGGTGEDMSAITFQIATEL